MNLAPIVSPYLVHIACRNEWQQDNQSHLNPSNVVASNISAKPAKSWNLVKQAYLPQSQNGS